MKKLNDDLLKGLEDKIKDLTSLLDEVTNLDLSDSDKIFDKKTNVLKSKAKNLEKQIKNKYKDYLDPKE